VTELPFLRCPEEGVMGVFGFRYDLACLPLGVTVRGLLRSGVALPNIGLVVDSVSVSGNLSPSTFYENNLTNH
jgi:hypothetical protein